MSDSIAAGHGLSREQSRGAGLGPLSARPILMAVPAPSVAGAAFGRLSDAGFYAELAKRLAVPLIEEVIADVLSRAELKIDHLHPNAEGHRILSVRTAERLRRLGLLGA